MLSKKQIDFALSLKDFDCFYDEIAEVTVRICHSKKGMFFLIMDDGMEVYKDMSCFLPFLWVGAANTRLWPRDTRGGILYYTQVKIDKYGDKYKNKYVGTCTDKDRERFKQKDVRKINDLFDLVKAMK